MSSIFMEQAILEAKKGIEAGHGGPFGCVIENKSKIIVFLYIANYTLKK